MIFVRKIKQFTLAVADPGFSWGGAPTPKIAIIFQFFAENCTKMKESGPRGARIPGAPPWIRQWLDHTDWNFKKLLVLSFWNISFLNSMK